MRRRWRLRRAGTRGWRRERLKCEFLPQLFSFVGTPRVPKWESKNGGSEAGQGTLPYSIVPLGLGSMAPRTVLRHPSEGWEL